MKGYNANDNVNVNYDYDDDYDCYDNDNVNDNKEKSTLSVRIACFSLSHFPKFPFLVFLVYYFVVAKSATVVLGAKMEWLFPF